MASPQDVIQIPMWQLLTQTVAKQLKAIELVPSGHRTGVIIGLSLQIRSLNERRLKNSVTSNLEWLIGKEDLYILSFWSTRYLAVFLWAPKLFKFTNGLLKKGRGLHTTVSSAHKPDTIEIRQVAVVTTVQQP